MTAPRTLPGPSRAAFDPARVREDFPILRQAIRGKPLVYLDSAATSQKPRAVLDALVRFYETDYSNIHRGVHDLAERATRAYEAVRGKVRRLLRAGEDREIVFVRGTTEAINLVARSFVAPLLGRGDEVLVTEMEHHSNIVPWQLLCEEKGARLRAVPVRDDGTLDLDALEGLLGARTRLLAVAHVSNVLGTINPVRRIVEIAHGRGVPVLVDGAQAAPRLPVDVRALDCDFYAFSGHKAYGPSGAGVLYGKAERLASMRPYQGGGEMIATVSFERTTYKEPPHRFEAGTPSIADVVGLGAAIDYLLALGLDAIAAHEQSLRRAAVELVSALPRLRVLGAAPEATGVLSFLVEGVHAHDVATILDLEGIAVRAGHHCAQPLVERFGAPATARASFGVYTLREDLEALAAGLRQVLEVFPG